MSCSSRPCDDHLEALLVGSAAEGDHLLRHPMGADDIRLVGDAKLFKSLSRRLHRGPV